MGDDPLGILTPPKKAPAQNGQGDDPLGILKKKDDGNSPSSSSFGVSQSQGGNVPDPFHPESGLPKDLDNERGKPVVFDKDHQPKPVPKVSPADFLKHTFGVNDEDLAPHKIYNNAKDFIQKDIENHPELLMYAPHPEELKKQILKGDGDINIQRYLKQRNTEIEDMQEQVKDQMADELFSLSPSKEKLTEYKNKIEQLEKGKQALQVNARELNEVQAVSLTPLPKDPKDQTETLREIGRKVIKMDDPVGVANQEKHIKDGTQATRDKELVDLENFNNERAGIDAKKKALDIGLGNGELSVGEYDRHISDLKLAEAKLFINNPAAKVVADRSLLADIIDKKRQGEGGGVARRSFTGGTLIDDLVSSAPTDKEVKDAIKTAKDQGYDISDLEATKLLENKWQIPGTSTLGNLYQSALGSLGTALNKHNPFLTDQQIESQQYQHESRLQPLQRQSQGVLGYVNQTANLVGTVAKWATLGKFLGAGADEILGSTVGADSELATKEILGEGGQVSPTVANVKKLSEFQKHFAGTALTSGLLIYPEAKDEAKKFTTDESKQAMYAGTITLLNTLAFTSIDPEGIINKIIGKSGEGSFAKDFVKAINKDGGLDKFTPETFKETILNTGKKILGANITPTATMTLLNVAEQATDVMFGKKPKIDLNETMKTMTDSFLQFAPLSLLQGAVGGIGDRNRKNLAAVMAYSASKDPLTFKDYMDGAVKEGAISQDEANKKIQIVNTTASLRATNDLPEHISEENKALYADNLRREIEIKQSMKADDDVRNKEKEAQIKVLQEERKNILVAPPELSDEEKAIQPYRDKTGVTKEQVSDDELLKNIAEQAQNISGGKENETGNKEDALRTTKEQAGEDLVNAAIKKYPAESLLAKEEPAEGTPEYKKNIRDDYFAKADFFTPEEKEKFSKLDEEGQDKMIDDKRAELASKPNEGTDKNSQPSKETFPKPYKASDSDALIHYGQVGDTRGEVGQPLERLEEIPIKDLKLDEFADINPDKVAEYSKKDTEIPPIEVHRDGDENAVYDGNTRVLAAKKKGQTTIKAWVSTVGDDGTFIERQPEDKENIKSPINKDQKAEPEKKIGKFESKARDIADKINNTKVPQWLINTDPTLNKGGLDADGLKKILADATIEVGKLLDKGVEIADAIKQGAEKLIDDYKSGIGLADKAKLKPEFEKQLRDGFENHYKENLPSEEKKGGDGEPPKEGEGKTETPEERTTNIRKANQLEIKKVADAYASKKTKKWVTTLSNGLKKITDANPGKTLYESAVSTLNQLMSNHYGDLTRDEAAGVLLYLKHEAGKKRSDLKDQLNSNEEQVRMGALLEEDPIKQIYEDASLKASQITSEAGTTLSFTRADLFDSENGLQLRRNDLIRASGGQKLSPEDEKFAKDKWEEEKALMEKIRETREQSLKEDFDKKIDALQKDFEEKLKSKKATVTDKTTRAKTLSQSGKELADKIRKFKSPKGSLQTDITFGLRNAAVEVVAQLVEQGAKLADAIKEVLKDDKFKGLNEDDLTNHLIDIASRKTPEETLQKIKDHVKEGGETDVTKEMVGKNLIKDYVDSHIGEVDQKDILDKATKDLKEVFPDIDKKKLIEAYLKEGDYKQDTKKDLEGGIAEQKKQLKNIAKLEEDIQDLQDYKKTRQRVFPTDREKSDYEKELSTKKEAELKKLRDERNKVARNERDAQKRKDKLSELDANIKRAEAGQDIITTYRNKSDKEVDEEIESKTRQLKKAINDNTPEDKVQQKLLQKAKDNAIKKTKEFQRRIDEGDYEEPEQKVLNKSDAELIRLQKEQAKVEGAFRERQDELRKNNKSNLEVLGDFTRSSFVAYWLRAPITLGKILIATMVRPSVEIVTRKTLIPVFDKFFPGIAKAALAGGESSSWRSMKLGIQAYFKQMGARDIENRVTKSEARFRKANRDYEDYKKNVVDNLKLPNSGASQKSIDYSNKKLAELKKVRDDRMFESLGNLVYQFIGGSSIKDALIAFVHRTNELERQFGKVHSEGVQGENMIKSEDSAGEIGRKLVKQILNGNVKSYEDLQKYNPQVSIGKELFQNVIDEIDYKLGFIGRSHSAAKTFSGRYSFAAGFMARIESAFQNGKELNADRILEIANESYFDWDSGKYQQGNPISDNWNKFLNHMGSMKDEKGQPSTTGKIFKGLLGTEVAIQRVPVNMLIEELKEYTLGTFRAAYFGSKASGEIKSDLKAEGFLKNTKEFKDALHERLSQIDGKEAAMIVRAFRKGTFGLGVYALIGTLIGIKFGIFPHLGQKKKKDEDQLRPDDLNPGQVMFGKTKLGETSSALIEHQPALFPMFLASGVIQSYNDEIKKGKTTPEAAAQSFHTHMNILLGDIPQLTAIEPFKQRTIDPAINYGIKQVFGDKHQGFTKKDEKDPTFKYYFDKGINLTPFDPSKIKIPVTTPDGKVDEKPLSEYPKEKWEEYNTEKKRVLKEELQSLNDQTFYVDKNGKVYKEEPDENEVGDYSEKTLKQLTVGQLKKLVTPAEAKATKAAKNKILGIEEDDDNN